MLYFQTLQFTNATKLNDPFDCHPKLLEYSNVPDSYSKVYPEDFVKAAAENKHMEYMASSWVCSLSKECGATQMWAYYGGHKGVCLELDMERVADAIKQCQKKYWFGHMYFFPPLDVNYSDISCKPDCFKNLGDLMQYQLTTKDKRWEHEQEVRLIVMNPNGQLMKLPFKPKNRGDN